MTDDNAPSRYIVFPRDNPTQWLAGKARNWMAARELGARKLCERYRIKVTPEQVWAVAVYDGETDEDAVVRAKGGG